MCINAKGVVNNIDRLMSRKFYLISVFVKKNETSIMIIRRVKSVNIRRGDIYYADLSPVVGSEQGGVRPVLIVQNDVGNRFSPTVIAAAITSQRAKANLPTHIMLNSESTGLAKDSVVLLEQVRTIDKHRLKERMGRIDHNAMEQVDQALSISFGLGSTEEVRRAT